MNEDQQIPNSGSARVALGSLLVCGDTSFIATTMQKSTLQRRSRESKAKGKT